MVIVQHYALMEISDDVKKDAFYKQQTPRLIFTNGGNDFYGSI